MDVFLGDCHLLACIAYGRTCPAVIDYHESNRDEWSIVLTVDKGTSRSNKHKECHAAEIL